MDCVHCFNFVKAKKKKVSSGFYRCPKTSDFSLPVHSTLPYGKIEQQKKNGPDPAQ